MSDDTTKVLPMHDAGDEKTTVLPAAADTAEPEVAQTSVLPTSSVESDESDDTTTVLPAAAPTEPADTTVLPVPEAATAADSVSSADTEVMEPTIAVTSQTREDEQATQALSQIPSTIDDFAEPAPSTASVGPIPLDVPLSEAIPAAAQASASPFVSTAPDPTPVPESSGATPAPQAEASTPVESSAPIESSAPVEPEPPVSGPRTAAPTQNNPEPPKGASRSTIIFGLIILLIGTFGMFTGLNPAVLGKWFYDMTPQTAIAIMCAAVGVILLVVALIWSIVKAVANGKAKSKQQQPR
ncbi:hypothetical protein EMB92_04655 [Bifidobacterium callitrichos]|uniref:Uncharacterized protein n=1 Tax=Bifidobacterium callitrichos TaxID=762209 RepID=A0A5M9ZDL9_9BIFI|nr:hypothetical protein [Bifidobacterium callitrichos]KAA8816224.1 hypothetical protein EMB92_04655 [Bifidobacterium callitrichos]